MEDHSFGECPICGQGQLLAVKNPITLQLFVMCDDCESQWRSPDEAHSFENALSNEIHDVEMATLEEIEAVGWIHL